MFYITCSSGNGDNGVRAARTQATVVSGELHGRGANNDTIVANGAYGLLVSRTSPETT